MNNDKRKEIAETMYKKYQKSFPEVNEISSEELISLQSKFST